MVRVMIAVIGLSMGPAWAGPKCGAYLADPFERSIRAADRAVSQGDVPAFETAKQQLYEGIPCLFDVMPSHLWADWLVTEAIVAYATDEDWQTPLATALRLNPEVNRKVGDSHEMADWVPPETQPGPAVELPEGHRLWIDGQPVSDELPPLAGNHLAQRQTLRGLESELLQDGELPKGWGRPIDEPTPTRAAKQARRTQPNRSTPRIEAFFGGLLGLGSFHQSSKTPAQDLDSTHRLALGGSVSGRVAIVGPLVGLWDGAVSASIPGTGYADGAGGPMADGLVALGAGTPTVAVVAGLGVRASRWSIPGDAVYRALFQPRLAVDVRGGQAARWDVSVGGGYMPDIATVHVRAGIAPGQQVMRPRIGLYAHGGNTWNRQGDAVVLTHLEWSVGLTAGMVLVGR